MVKAPVGYYDQWLHKLVYVTKITTHADYVWPDNCSDMEELCEQYERHITLTKHVAKGANDNECVIRGKKLCMEMTAILKRGRMTGYFGDHMLLDSHAHINMRKAGMALDTAPHLYPTVCFQIGILVGDLLYERERADLDDANEHDCHGHILSELAISYRKVASY